VVPRPTRRPRRRLRLRHPLPFWIAAVALTALTTSTVARVTDAAAAERDRWGERVAVAVASRDLEPGEALEAELRELPAGLVPAGALRTAPAGEVVAAWIGAGEIVLEDRLAPAGLSAVAARLPPGTRGVAVPPGVAPLPVSVGDRVDVLGPALIASRALVVDVGDGAVTVAVRDGVAERVAEAVTLGTAVLVLSEVSSPRSR
jgi:Flp pilus assembly protein CpaB